MRNTTQAMGALLVFASSAAFAGNTLVVSASDSGPTGGSPITGESATYTANLDQFDPALGELTGVELSITALHAGEFNITSNAVGGGYIIFYIDYAFDVNGFGGIDGNLLSLDWVTEPTAGSPFGAAPGHFNTPFNPVATGASALETFGTQLDFANTYGAGDAEFSEFIGTGTLPFAIEDWAVFSLATTGASVSWVLSSDASISVEATYTFIPIPSPGTLSLFAASGLLAVRRRR